MSNLTNVVIVGRSNVGKSALFNRLIQKRLSIVYDEENVTRDRIYHVCEWSGQKFNLIDTGGISKKLDLSFQDEINLQVDIAIRNSKIIIFLTSGKDLVTKEDLFVASKLKKLSNKIIIPVVNKVDNPNMMNEAYDFYKLGFGEPLFVSSIHGIGINDLLDKIVKNIEKNTTEEDNGLRISIIGKPNVGKSTLINTVLDEKRVIVSPLPGTTRDSIDTRVKFKGKEFIFVDTAGIKKNKQALNEIEKYSEIRTNLTILSSDIVLFLLDYTNDITFIDEKIMGILKKEYKPTIVVVNKLDLLESENLKKIENEIRQKFKFAAWIQIEFISALNRKNVVKLFDKIIDLKERSELKISTSSLNQFLMELQILKKPPRQNGILIKFSYIVFVNNKYPVFVIFSNHPDKIHFSYKRFIENQLRNVYDLRGIPIKIVFKEKR